MRYQNDRQGALSQIVSIRRLLVPCVDCRLGWRVRLGSCRECILAVEEECSPVITSNHPACSHEMVQGMSMGEREVCEGACVDVRGVRRTGPPLIRECSCCF